MTDHPCEQGLTPLPDALSRILETIKPLTASEQVPLKHAWHRVLAREITAPFDVPGFTNSAMDGYALSLKNLSLSQPLEIVGTSWAGKPFDRAIYPGQCVRIFTGAIVPEGTNAVIMQEEVEPIDNTIRLKRLPSQGEYLRLKGSDLRQGERVLNQGQCLDAAALGLLASLGIQNVRVYHKPSIAYFSTGDELRGLDERLEPGQIYDSNRYSLHGLLTGLPVDSCDLGRLPDVLDSLTATLKQASRDHDLILSSGGASVGEADLLKNALKKVGQVHLWKIAIKPGKPLLFGQIGNAYYIGLPGNPVSVHVTFNQIVRPVLWKLAAAGFYQPLRIQAHCRNSIKKSPGRLEFIRGFLAIEANSQLSVTALSGQGSYQQAALCRANCYIVLPADSKGTQAGEWVEVEPFDNFILGQEG